MDVRHARRAWAGVRHPCGVGARGVGAHREELGGAEEVALKVADALAQIVIGVETRLDGLASRRADRAARAAARRRLDQVLDGLPLVRVTVGRDHRVDHPRERDRTNELAGELDLVEPEGLPPRRVLRVALLLHLHRAQPRARDSELGLGHWLPKQGEE